MYYFYNQEIHSFPRHHCGQSPHDLAEVRDGASRQMRVQHDVDVVLLSCNGPILMEGGDSGDDYGVRLLQIVRAGQSNGAVKSITRLYEIIHDVRAGVGASSTFSLQQRKGIRFRITYDYKRVGINLISKRSRLAGVRITQVYNIPAITLGMFSPYGQA